MQGDAAAISAIAPSDAAPMPELVFGELALVAATATAPNSPSAQPPIDHAHRVIQVIAQAARALQDRPVEVTLNPEELGRVRLTLHSVDGSMSVAVAVERPETLDLLRRNIDLLASQLRELGYKNLSFSFAGQGDNFASSQDQRDDKQSQSTDDPVSPLQAPQPNRARIIVGHSGGVDIRL
jgi:flagellar hook-length control protein FliK